MKTKILFTEFVTHDTKSFILEKPEGYKFIPGQATEVNIDEDKWRDEKRPFTFASRKKDGVLQFIVKKYPDHNGVTKRLHELVSGDTLEIGEAWGAIKYNGKGVFIAGGAGITPFIAILRELYDKNELKGNRLLFSNKREEDIILEKEFRDMLGNNFITTLTEVKSGIHQYGRIDKKMISRAAGNNFDQNFYVCGPPAFVKDIQNDLSELGADVDSIIFEK